MNANWYVDPLGRFDGRYWDGQQWTDQVKDGGRLVIDPDWPPMATHGPQGGAAASQVELTAIRFDHDGGASTSGLENPPAAGVDATHLTTDGSDAAPVWTLDAQPIRDVTQSPGVAPAVDATVEEVAEVVPRVGVPSEPPAIPIPGSAPDDGLQVEGSLADPPAVAATPDAGNLFGTPRVEGAVRAVTPTVRVPDAASESPTRTVARLEAADAPEVASEGAEARVGGSGDTISTVPERRSRRRWAWLLGLAVLLAGLLLILLPRLSGDDAETADDVDTVETTDNADTADSGDSADRADDVDTDSEGDAPDADSGLLPATDDDGGDTDGDGAPAGDDADGDDAAPSDAADPDADASDTTDDGVVEGASLDVGALELVNGADVLRELEEWHIEALAVRGEDLQTQCWLGEIGQAAVQAAHCGPVGATDDGEVTFDLIPLNFEDLEPGRVRVTPLLDAVTEASVLPPGLTLIGLDGPLDASAISTGPSGKGG